MRKLIILGVLLIGCQSPQEYTEEIVYAKDERTSLCFAMWGMGGTGSTITNVPCTSLVEEQIRMSKARHSRR